MVSLYSDSLNQATMSANDSSRSLNHSSGKMIPRIQLTSCASAAVEPLIDGRAWSGVGVCTQPTKQHNQRIELLTLHTRQQWWSPVLPITSSNCDVNVYPLRFTALREWKSQCVTYARGINYCELQISRHHQFSHNCMLDSRSVKSESGEDC